MSLCGIYTTPRNRCAFTISLFTIGSPSLYCGNSLGVPRLVSKGVFGLFHRLNFMSFPERPRAHFIMAHRVMTVSQSTYLSQLDFEINNEDTEVCTSVRVEFLLRKDIHLPTRSLAFTSERRTAIGRYCEEDSSEQGHYHYNHL